MEIDDGEACLLGWWQDKACDCAVSLPVTHLISVCSPEVEHEAIFTREVKGNECEEITATVRHD